MKLYEIMADYEKLASMDMESDGDMEAFLELLKTLEGTFDQKAENYCKLIYNLSCEAEAFREEKERLGKKQKSLENRIESIKKYLKFEASKIIETGSSRKVGLFTIGIRSNPESLEVIDEDSIPDEYFETMVVLNKVKVKESLKNGEAVEGVQLTRGTSLRIS
jgi:hypothetical protein